jgi:hypothetical protein
VVNLLFLFAVTPPLARIVDAGDSSVHFCSRTGETNRVLVLSVVWVPETPLPILIVVIR